MSRKEYVTVRRGDTLSLSQFATLIGKSYPTVLAMKKRNQIRTIRVGGINLVTADEIDRFLVEGNYDPNKLHISEVYDESTGSS